MKLSINAVFSLSLLFGVMHTPYAFSDSLWREQAPSQESTYDEPCPKGTMVIEEQTESPVLLTLGEAKCGGSMSKVKVTLKNVSTKPIHSYEIMNIQDYENKKGSVSSQGVSGAQLQPDQSIVINFDGGFPLGYSYGKWVGALKKSVFKVSKIEFTDGSVWQPQIEAREKTEKPQ